MLTRRHFLNVVLTSVLLVLASCGPWVKAKGVYLLFNESPEERELPTSSDATVPKTETSIIPESPFTLVSEFATFQLLQAQLTLNNIFRPPLSNFHFLVLFFKF